MAQSDMPGRAGGRAEHTGAARSLLDRTVERLTRHVAGHSSRRGLLGRVGAWATFGALIPMLPVERASAAQTAKPKFKAPTPFAASAQTTDPTACNYWRYCAIDGFLCASCGGGVHSCPPGTSPSPTSWIGTCFNPGDGQSYLLRIVTVAVRMPVASPCVLARKVTSQAIGLRPIMILSGVSVRAH